MNRATLLIALAACTPNPTFQTVEHFDPAQRERLFIACVQSLSVPGTLAAAGSDLDEAVEECSDAAFDLTTTKTHECIANCGGSK